MCAQLACGTNIYSFICGWDEKPVNVFVLVLVLLAVFSLFEDENTENFANKWKEINEYFFSVKKQRQHILLNSPHLMAANEESQMDWKKRERSIQWSILVPSPRLPIQFTSSVCVPWKSLQICVPFSRSLPITPKHICPVQTNTHKKKIKSVIAYG